MSKWKVYLKSRHIDTVFYTANCDGDYVRKTLIDHDGYHPAITVLRVS